MVDNTLPEEDPTPETASPLRENPEDAPPQSESENPNRSEGVTGLLRDIFKRNASLPAAADDEQSTAAPSNDGLKSDPDETNPAFGEASIWPEFNDSDSPFLPDDTSVGIARSSQAAEKGKNQNSQRPAEKGPFDETPAPNKGVLKSFVTGILRNTGALEPPPDKSHEGAIDDRLSSVFPSEPADEKSDESWEDKFLASLTSPQEEEEAPTQEYATSFYDPNEKYLSGGKAQEDDEDDYLFQEWVGFTKSLKNKTDNPAPKPENPPELKEPDPFIQLPAHSSYEVNEEALFEEKIKDFKDKNSFLYTPNQDRGSISLDEMRQVVLEDIHTERNDPQKKKKHISVDKSTRSFHHMKRAEVIALAFLGFMVLAVVFAILAILNRANLPQATAVQNTPTNVIRDIAPLPVGIRITGGWYFPLSKNTMVDGRWKPQGAEWLEGSDIRRIVTLPWNKQLEAATRTLVQGDEIDLFFNNDEHIVFKVDKVEKLAADQTNAGSQTTPSMLIILYDENSPDRWVITCLPKTE